MKLQYRFLQLPICFDAARLAAEIATISEEDWRAHPAGFAGNDFLPLIAVNGSVDNESFEGRMRPTRHLSAERPYLQQTLAAFGAVLGRTRLMRLSGNAEVSEHSDVNYYWRERMRVHVPIITQPAVKFYCGPDVVHMAQGECWIFDTWSLHRVVNDQTEQRIHLVADTVGGRGMLDLMARGRVPGQSAGDWRPRQTLPSSSPVELEFESVNVPLVMSPWEVREHITFLLGEAVPNQRVTAEVARIASVFLLNWRARWSASGDSEAGWPHYRVLLDGFARDLAAVRAGDVRLRNDVDFLQCVRGLVLDFALTGRARTGAVAAPAAS